MYLPRQGVLPPGTQKQNHPPYPSTYPHIPTPPSSSYVLSYRSQWRSACRRPLEFAAMFEQRQVIIDGVVFIVMFEGGVQYDVFSIGTVEEIYGEPIDSHSYLIS